MKITVDTIAKLNPCESRFGNFKENYPNFEGTLTDFISLDKITYDDKVWVAIRLLSKNQLVEWSVACAESVKHIFESRYPENKSVSNLLDYMKTIEDYERLTAGQHQELLDLRRDAADAAYAATYAATIVATPIVAAAIVAAAIVAAATVATPIVAAATVAATIVATPIVAATIVAAIVAAVVAAATVATATVAAATVAAAIVAATVVAAAIVATPIVAAAIVAIAIVAATAAAEATYAACAANAAAEEQRNLNLLLLASLETK